MNQLVQCCPYCRREVWQLEVRDPGIAERKDDILVALRSTNLDQDESITQEQRDGLKELQINLRQARLNYEELVSRKPEQEKAYTAGYDDTEAKLRQKALNVINGS